MKKPFNLSNPLRAVGRRRKKKEVSLSFAP